MLSHTSLIVSSTFMACIYKHTHTHREMTFHLTISTSLEDWSQGKAARNGFWLKLRGNFYRILFLFFLSFELPFSSTLVFELELRCYLSFPVHVHVLTCTARLVILIFLLNFYQTHLWIRQLAQKFVFTWKGSYFIQIYFYVWIKTIQSTPFEFFHIMDKIRVII
jgi:hypothetical protein